MHHYIASTQSAIHTELMPFPPPAQTSRLFRIRFLFCEWHLSKQKVVCFLAFAAFAAEAERGRGGDVIRMFLLLFHFLFLPPAALCMPQKRFFLLKGCQTQCRRRRQKTNPPSARLPHFSPFSFRSHPSPAVPWIPLSPRISVPLKQWKRGGCTYRKERDGDGECSIFDIFGSTCRTTYLSSPPNHL